MGIEHFLEPVRRDAVLCGDCIVRRARRPLGTDIGAHLCLVVTAARIAYGVNISIVTWWRIDEILAGGCIALAFGSTRVAKAAARLPALTPFLLAPLLLASCHPALGPLSYARPYFAALLIGSTILRSQDSLQRLLCGRALGYLAEDIVRSLRNTSANVFRLDGRR